MTSSATLYDTVMQSDRYDVLFNGLHENIPHMIYNDPDLYVLLPFLFLYSFHVDFIQSVFSSKLTDSLNALLFADECLTKCHTTQVYAFMRYVPYSAVQIHVSCTSTTRRKIAFPISHKTVKMLQ